MSYADLKQAVRLSRALSVVALIDRLRVLQRKRQPKIRRRMLITRFALRLRLERATAKRRLGGRS